MLAREDDRVAMITVFACIEGKDMMFRIRGDGMN
jgi:hypothetical protein